MNDPLIDRLNTALRAPLPGHDVFMRMSGYKRPNMEEVLQRRPPPRQSAVLILLYPHRTELHTVLMLRPEYEGVHSGQVAFPGGRREDVDPDLQATALREFAEETGARVDARIMGSLSPIFIPPSHSLVTPFVAHAPQLGPTDPDPREVAALIRTPLSELLRDDILKRREMHVQVLGGRAEVPYYDIQGHVVWGATAMMVAELRALLGKG